MVDSWCCILGALVLFAAVAVHLLSPLQCITSLVLAFAVYCRPFAVLVMHSLGKQVQFTAAVAVYLLSWCCCLVLVASAVYCRPFAVLVLSTAATVAVPILSLSCVY
ncbi:hypothetical protein MAM1_0987c11405 [Mucor ambiguus]|uniref:Uncharacterized protein n=1 Tax=Mucor ambiguus TaxID=91626 RepID=A0A0C9MWR3_9FUNG|nr:hypothetical protein MAM1_0987c11405 [Mucor ambiguus]